MAQIIGSPSRYIQGKGELKNLCTYASNYGSRLFILTSVSGRKRVEPSIQAGMDGTGVETVYESFNRECSMNEINRVMEAAKEAECDMIAGVGGGKIHDTAKAVAHYMDKAVIIVPTIASTDAPCSALSVIYSDEGVFDKYLFLPASPNAVLVDTEVVSKAPTRLLVAGMGDALATYFEARACSQSSAVNCVGGRSTLAAMALARLCYETLLENGVSAALAVTENVCTKAVEHVIEANTYLSGIGFESGGLAGAHAIHNGLTAIEETHAMYHGEKVAFGTLVQLVLENADSREIEDVVDFCNAVGLPTTLAQLGIKEVKAEQIMEVAELAAAEGDTLGNMPFAVTPEDVYAAIMAADAIGRNYAQ
ncbi:glycerol dehydrogenase [Lachnospiraceae bacterium]|uniref:glycerol dehydrogenase n=1 Tax=Extibacter sp. GGCC_0201 TaxID=2731209 RepID=UPI001AA12469|nr:glycerol dehydrogenase [Extibacter sp. GGCC_0201]MBO1720108.1 glycerol dehydrogenase [Extibacter sp. GGCC_0201]BDF33052.1 glycerol dehydrogenase [Lachnospiraceae bacterium]BDF37056.1 glycerol dehydrogenase [Lachnospiraceae bacterium]